MRVGVPDGSLTRFSGLAAVTELVERLGVIERFDTAVGSIKVRDRGFTAGQVLVGMAAAQLCGRTSWSGWTGTALPSPIRR
ncbi:MAG: hypothetical protein AB7L91_18330 [Dehalococcoidia bacterium]